MKQKISCVLNFISTKAQQHPYMLISLFVLYLFTIINVANVDLGMGDFNIYMNTLQTINNNGILYTDAIDSKNMGFFLVFFLVYKLYTLFFSTTEYFYFFQAGFLFLIYLLSGSLVYKIISSIWDKKQGIFISILSLLFLSTITFVYYINQVQIALLFYLNLIYIVVKTINRYHPLYFGLYGYFLGICFSMASPYLLLALITPCLAFLHFQKDGSIKLLVLRCLIAFLGFIISLLPFIFYFLPTMPDWIYWNLKLTSSAYFAEASILKRILVTLQSVFLTIYWWNPEAEFAHFTVMRYIYFLWILFFTALLFKKTQIDLSIKKKALLIMGLVSIFPRLLLIYAITSYNVYTIPFLFLLLPILFEYLKAYSRKLRSLLIISLCIWSILPILLVFNNLKHSKITTPKELKDFTLDNIDKSPSIIVGDFNLTYSYSTKWRPLYFNGFSWLQHYKDTKEKIYLQKPEIILGVRFLVKDDGDFATFLSNSYKAIGSEDLIYIRNDSYSNYTIRGN